MTIRNSLFSAILLCFLMAAPAWGMETVTFISLIDGDSLLVKYEGRAQEVRLIGVDAPEWGQEYGAKARSHALSFCYGKQMGLEFDMGRKDRYGRLLAYVYCGNQMVNEVLLRDGYAIAVKVKPNTKYYKRFKALETQARKERRGFWLRGGLKETPAQFRKRKKK